MEKTENCLHCGKLLVRKRRKGKLEKLRDFRNRRFCNHRCSGKYQHSDERANIISEAKENLASENETEMKTAFEILQEIANDKKMHETTRVSAAKALLPYQSKKTNERMTKEQERQHKKENSGPSKFAAGPAPKVVGRIGK